MENNRIAVVTGGTSGIGFATAKLLVSQNFTVYIVGRNANSTQHCARQLNCKYIVADLSSLSCVNEICKPFQQLGLDLLVNNAAIAHMIPLENISPECIEEHFSINLYTPLLLIKTLVPALKYRQGSVVNVSSIITTRGTAGYSVYAATKGAIESITKSLAIELAPSSIRVNAVCPGAINTPMLSKSKLAKKKQPNINTQTMPIIPLQREGEPREVAAAIYAQYDNRYVTGSIWHIDGGVGV